MEQPAHQLLSASASSALSSSAVASSASSSSSVSSPFSGAIRSRLTAWQRDLQVVLDGFRGRHPAPLTMRPRRPAARTLSTLQPRLLRVIEVTHETPDAVTLTLAELNGAPIAFEAGQFLTLMLTLPGDKNSGEAQIVRRAYSACSSPLDAQNLSITSKRVVGGKVSNYLNDRAEVGMLIQALGPSGNFTPRPHLEKRRHLVLIGGGSGITPLMSILKTVLRVESGSRVSLIYGNRGEDDIIFRKKLDELGEVHPERLVLRHVLSAPPAAWRGGVGLLDENVLAGELAALPAAAELSTEYYLCGPEPMMNAARALLVRRGVAPAAIYEERFATMRYGDDAPSTIAQPLELRRGELQQCLTVKAGETLLEAGLAAGLPMPFSCAMGGCGACKAHLTSGQVAMQEPNCLTANERQEGYVLCCVARPRSAVTIELPNASEAHP